MDDVYDLPTKALREAAVDLPRVLRPPGLPAG
jgi:hypothetical protein